MVSPRRPDWKHFIGVGCYKVLLLLFKKLPPNIANLATILVMRTQSRQVLPPLPKSFTFSKKRTAHP